MAETRTLKQLAAELIGERAEDLLDFALQAGGVTLVSKDGRKVRIRWQALEGWKAEVEEKEVREIDHGRLGEAGRETEDSGRVKRRRVKKVNGGGER